MRRDWVSGPLSLAFLPTGFKLSLSRISYKGISVPNVSSDKAESATPNMIHGSGNSIARMRHPGRRAATGTASTLPGSHPPSHLDLSWFPRLERARNVETPLQDENGGEERRVEGRDCLRIASERKGNNDQG